MAQTPPLSEEILSPGLLARLTALRENKEFERFWKFAIVGTIGAVIDFGTLNFLLGVGWFAETIIPLPIGKITELGIAGTIAFILAVVSNFIWNRYWTYPDSRSKSLVSQLITFFLINIVGLLIRIPTLELLSQPLATLAENILSFLTAAQAEWFGSMGSWGIAVVLAMFWNFFINRYWTYNDVE